MCSCNIYAWTLSILERKYRPGMAGSCCIWFFCFHAFELSFGGNDNGVEFFILYDAGNNLPHVTRPLPLPADRNK
jgi:hypothetical protein